MIKTIGYIFFYLALLGGMIFLFCLPMHQLYTRGIWVDGEITGRVYQKSFTIAHSGVELTIQEKEESVYLTYQVGDVVPVYYDPVHSTNAYFEQPSWVQSYLWWVKYALLGFLAFSIMVFIKISMQDTPEKIQQSSLPSPIIYLSKKLPVTCIMGVFWALFLCWAWVTEIVPERELQEMNRITNAIVTECKAVKSKHRIYYQFQTEGDPDGETFEGRSQLKELQVNLSCSQVIGQTIPVYYDPANPMQSIPITAEPRLPPFAFVVIPFLAVIELWEKREKKLL